MSKQDDDLAELQKFFDQEISKIDKSKQPKKDQEKKSLTDTVRQELNIPVEDRYLYDLLGAYAGKRAAGAMDRGVRNMPEPSASTMRGVGFDTAGLGPANQPRPPAPQGFAPPSAPSAPDMGRPAVGGPAGPVGGPPAPLTQMGGSGTFNYGKKFGLTDIEASRALNMSKDPGGASDLIDQRREAMQKIQQMGGGYAENPRFGGIMTPDQGAGRGPKMSFTQQSAVPPSPDLPSGKPAAFSQLPPAQPVSAVPPKPSPLTQLGMLAKQGTGAVLNAPGVSGFLGGLGAAESGQEYFKRQSRGDVPGQVMAGMGVLGGGMAMVPNPLVKALGAALSTASPLSLYLSDKVKSAPGSAELPELTEEEIMLASRPYTTMRPIANPPLRPRVPAPGTNLPPVEFYR